MRTKIRLTLLFSLSLVALILLTGCFGSKPAEEEEEGFVPVLRFAVTSDVHIRSNDPKKSAQDYQSHAILEHFCQSVYAYSDSQKYKNLDAVFFVGDITQTGYDDEFEDFFQIVNQYAREETEVRAVLGNHEFRATRYDDGTNKDDRYSKTSVAATFEKYKEYGDYEEVNAHLIIGGYHFLVLNMDLYADYEKFSDESLDWLKAELKIAAEDDPTGEKPIFVFQHVPPSGTVNGIKSGGDSDLRKVLNDYPQVVDFSGHSHRPVLDPRSLWQEDFTAINTGGLAYMSIYLVGNSTYTSVRAMDHSGAFSSTSSETEIRNAGLYYFVEIDAAHQMRLVIYNLYTDAVEKIVWLGGATERQIGTFESRKEAAEAPVFDNGAQLSPILIDKTRALISIPQASCEDGVSNYRVHLYHDNTLLGVTYRLSCNHLGAAMPTSIPAPLDNLQPATTYTVKVIPIGCWGKEGKPLTYTFTTKDTSAPALPDVLSVQFDTNGQAINAITGEALLAYESPSVYYDNEIGMNAASMNGSNSFVFSSMYDTYPAITNGFTLEAYVYVDKYSSSTVCPIGHMQSGGFGLQIKNGELQFLVYTGNKAYEYASATMHYGEWIHVVGCYDGQTISLYMNGEKVSETKASASAWTLPTSGAGYLVLGGDATHASDVGTTFSKCKLAAVALYSNALTDAQVLARYQGMKK